ncbi:MAG: hypothetical protein H7Z38_14635 [Rubrivivax sp.]|nr:hypothetical protein [Pyrinomonadaceae bacterium]
MMGPYNQQNVPDKWRARLRAHIKEKTGDDRDQLSATDFASNSRVYLQFPDGSFALFRYAFCLIAPEDNEAAVFTEHCGYHIFSAYDLKIEALESTWLDNE